MFRFIKIMLEMVLPIFITFHFLPKIWNMIFGEEEEDRPKKKKKPKLRQMGFPDYRGTPPPPPRQRDLFIDDRLREKRLELSKERERLVQQFEQYEVRGGRIVKKEPEPSFVVEPEKKKHFTKGVDPDFL